MALHKKANLATDDDDDDRLNPSRVELRFYFRRPRQEYWRKLLATHAGAETRAKFAARVVVTGYSRDGLRVRFLATETVRTTDTINHQ